MDLHKRLKRKNPAEAYVFPEGFNLSNKDHVSDLWNATFDIRSMLFKKDDIQIYKQGNGRLFNQTICTNGL